MFYATHVGGRCLDNVTDPGWCVWCGRDMRPAGDAAAPNEPASMPVEPAQVQVWPKPGWPLRAWRGGAS